MFIRLETKTALEQIGIVVIEETDPAIINKWNTNIFLKKPNGMTTPFYNGLWEVPVLPHNTEIDLDYYGYPTEVANVDCGAYIHVDPNLVATWSKHGMEGIYHAEGYPVAWFITLGALIVIAVIIGITLTLIYFIVDRLSVIHGRETKVEKIDDNIKAITKPNCQARMWDSENNCWVPGDEWSDPGQYPSEWIKWLVYGAIAIGGVVVVVTLVKAFLPASRPPPPQPPT